ncbi:EAL domain-containing protein [Sulfurimonas sp. HSL-1716]|uniref:bifunctional diguanylate cyclase/phosphodiesterase n=1 Tax=Hydrocurvibacter sulfurireducens TaxID=3131937 RepID=UPI0031F9C46B
MKTYNTYYTTLHDFEQFLDVRDIEDGENLLIQIFTAKNDEKSIAALLDEIVSLLPSASVIGATTDGEICNGTVSTEKTVVSLSVFEKTKLKTALVENCVDSEDTGRKLAKELIDQNTKLLITFSEGITCNGEEYLKGISSVSSEVIVAGGMAGDNAKFKTTYVFTQNGITSNGAVGAALSNHVLQVHTDYNFNWLSIGKNMTVTKAKRNRVYTIDGIPAYDIYKRYLGKETADELPVLGVEYPMIVKRNGIKVARAVLRRHRDRSLSFAGNLNRGDIVTFGYGDVESILNNSILSEHNLQNKSIESIFIYSCMARRRFMPDFIQQEIEPLNEITGCSGFFTYGEFFSTKKRKELLNQSMTILTLSESKNVNIKKTLLSNREIKLNTYQKSIKTLSHILNVTTNELHKRNKKLEKFSKEILAREESLNLAQKIGHFGSWEVDLKTGNSILSKESYRMYKIDFNETHATIKTFLNRVVEEDKPLALKTLEELKDGTIKSIELRIRRADDMIIHVLLNGKMIFSDKGAPIKIVGTTLDITELVDTKKKLEEQTKLLNFQAYYDSLTKLPNRALFNDRLEQTIANSKRNDQIFALLFIDLDNFKEINDTLGHHIGDKVLQIVSKRLSTCVRIDDSLSRLGGDEFTVIIHNLKNPEAVAEVAQKLLDMIKSKITVDNNELYLSASIGISIFPKDASNSSDLIKFSDSAMYKAKEKGKNNYQFYSADMTQIAFEKILMQTSLHVAVNKKEFVVYYQPQVDTRNEFITGVEALVRWDHPTMGIIPPDKFIPLAEEIGFIVSLDKYVIRQAMSDFADWNKKGLSPGILSLNLSTKLLNSEHFIDDLKYIIKETGFNVKQLELEITESQMMQDPLSSIQKLQTLSDMGITIAIDDFGTGYSSLAYLKRLPVDKLKIDKSFVDDLPNDEEDCAISKAIIALAKSLNLKIVAEGVERKEQKEFLLENGCDLIQGYYYSKPLPKKDVEVLFKAPFFYKAYSL